MKQPTVFIKYIKPGDIIAIAITAGVIFFLAFAAYTGNSDNIRLKIESDHGQFVYPLNVDQKVSIKGPLGALEVGIHDQTVSVTLAPCRDKLCVKAGNLSKAGDWTACLPNRVFISLETGQPTNNGPEREKNQTDAISY